MFPVAVALDALDVQTWLEARANEQRRGPTVGVYIEALDNNGKNLALHPRKDHEVCLRA